MTQPKPELGTNQLGTTSLSKSTTITTETITYSADTNNSKIEPVDILNTGIGRGELGSGELSGFNGSTSFSYTIQTKSVSGTTTLGAQTVSQSFDVANVGVSGSTTATSDVTVSNYNLSTTFLKPNIPAETVETSFETGDAKILTLPTVTDPEAEYNTDKIAIDVPGNQGQITVLINGKRITTYTNIEIQKRLNEVDTFSFEAFIEDGDDRALIQENNEVKIIENYDSLLFKGVLNEVEYQSSFRAKCEGNGMVQKLLDRKTNRDEYSNTAGDQIIKTEVPTSIISRGTIETAPNISVRFDHDNLARAVAGVANATGYDWYISQAGSDFDTDQLNFVKDAGSQTSQKTYEIGGNAQMVERNKDDGFVANDITLLGRGDGINQLESRVFAPATAYTDTSTVIDKTESTSFTVDDTTQLGSTNDNLVVRVGTEVMDVTITDSTTLSINSRGLDNYEGDATEQIKHYENIRVWRLENKTTGVGRFSPDNPESGSSIDSKGVKEQRDTDKTIVDISTLEKTADLELKNRFEDIFRVQVQPVEPRDTKDLQLGDTVTVKDLTAMDVDNEFKVTGMDIKRNSAEEGTVLHLANRPRRLTERLSEIESNTDTLNAHMQGATNFNGEHFEDNVDNTHPLTNKIFVPEDVVAVNKFELTFAREKFRGYVQNSEHSHSFEVTHPKHSHTIEDVPDHTHDFSINIPEHSHDIENFLESDGTAIRFSQSIPTTKNLDSLSDAELDLVGGTIQIDNIEEDDGTQGDTGPISIGSAGSQHAHRAYNNLPWELSVDDNSESVDVDLGSSDLDHEHQWPDDFFVNEAIGVDLLTTNDGNPPATTEGGGSYVESTSTDTQNTPSTTETSKDALGTTESETTKESGGPEYGVFEPGSEPDIDVEVYVDGNLVTTVNNVSVGDEITNPINLKNDLADPLTGTYHDIELKPIDTGGGNNGRSRLTADVTEKVFIESTL